LFSAIPEMTPGNRFSIARHRAADCDPDSGRDAAPYGAGDVPGFFPRERFGFAAATSGAVVNRARGGRAPF
jgi:hypothetical protein